MEPPDTALLETFANIVRLPAAMWPHAHLAADPAEMALVVAMAKIQAGGGSRALTAEEVAARLELPPAEVETLLAGAAYRAVVDRVVRDGAPAYAVGNFYRRLTYLSIQDNDGWRSVPPDVRADLLAWHLEENIRHHDLVRRLGQLCCDPDGTPIHNRDFLLLDEALAMVDAATFHVVVPCDCRTTVMACDFPRWDTCLRLDDRGRRTLEQGEGKIVNRAECREIVLNADRVGLMHTGQRAERGRPPILNGNCCACCSYPIRAGVALGMDKQWPLVHYRAERDTDRCDDCGICADRCHFGAFHHVTEAGSIAFEPDRCHGCGLCATGCPRSAVHMAPLHRTPGRTGH